MNSFKNSHILLILLIFNKLISFASEPSITILRGKITDLEHQPIIGASIYFPDLKTGGITDTSGYYQVFNLPRRNLLVQVTSIGFNQISTTINLQNTKIQNFELKPSIIEINEIAVTGQAMASKINKIPTPVSIVTPTELLQTSSTNIIDALSTQPGVSQITTGAGISKPVIRGLGYNRVVVLNDGVKQEGQQWGDEHGIEIDEFDVNKVEILKGPGSLMYGSDAMAGVINFLPAPILPEGRQQINILTNYQTNNGLAAMSLNYAGHLKRFVWDARVSSKTAHAYQNKYDGYVYNSGFSEKSLSLLTGINQWWGYSNLTLSAYFLTPGIIEGNRDSVTGAFTKPVVLLDQTVGETIATQNDLLSYTHQMPYQQVQHYKIVWKNNLLIGDGSLKAIFGYQQNRRQEYANILTPTNYGLYFQLHTLSYDVHYNMPEMKGYGLSVGISGMSQNSMNKGSEFLVPAYHLFDAGIFVVAKKTFGKLDISGGIRYDIRFEDTESLYLDAIGNVTNASNASAIERFKGFSTQFDGISGSLGATYRLNESWVTKLNFSRGFRAPNIGELASNGVHEGTMRYEIGNPDLKSENSFQTDFELDFNTEHVSAQLNLFMNRIDHFIFSRKLNAINGTDSIRNGYISYLFDAGNAQLYGGEFSFDFHPHPFDWLHIENTFSYVNAQLIGQPDSTRYLPFTPAPKWILNVRANLNLHNKFSKNSYISFGFEHDFRQNNIYSAYRTETPTPAYTIFSASLGTDLIIRGKKLCSVYLNGSNLTDLAYQSHLSRLKYLSINELTGRTGVFNMGRNLSLKLLFPIDF